MTFEEKDALIRQIHATLLAACPLVGLTFADFAVKSSWVVMPDPSATTAQLSALATALTGVDNSQAAATAARAAEVAAQTMAQKTTLGVTALEASSGIGSTNFIRNGAPLPMDGVAGDHWIDTATGIVYERV